MQKPLCFWNIALSSFCVCVFLFNFIASSYRTSSFIDVAHSPPLLSEICEKNALSSWQNRTPTSEEAAAALKLQAIWRGTYVRKVLNSRKPGVSSKNAFKKNVSYFTLFKYIV